MGYETILIETVKSVGVITLNRPKALNALNARLIDELNHALDAFEADSAIGCIVLTGSEKAFAAGADIKEMVDLTYPQIYLDDLFRESDRVAARRKPMVAAVAGFALGGGCELALMCDFILAAENARFGQPEINLGVEQLLPEALAVAAVIAEKSLPVAMLVKESVNRAFEVSLAEGIRFERRVFHATFASHDQKEGMAAFIDKRKPDFKDC